MPETAGQISGPNRPEEHSVMFGQCDDIRAGLQECGEHVQ